jgi:hypothetical protein
MKRTNLIFLAVAMTLLFAFNCISASVAFAATAPTITTQPVSLTVNAGKPASFSVVASGTTPITYQWYQNGSPISGATGTTYSIASTPETDNNTYYSVTVKNSAGSVTSNWVQLTVDGKPVITEQPASITVTEPSVVTFNVGYAGSGNLTFQWYKNSVLYTPSDGDCTGSTCTTGQLTLANNGDKYTVKILNDYGSVTSTAAVITVLAPTGTSPFVGNWSGTAKITAKNKGSETYQADASFSQTATALICTLVITGKDGIPGLAGGMFLVNGLNVYGVHTDGDLTTTYSGAFTSNQLTLNLIAVDNSGATGSGAINVSTNHNSMTGSGTYTDPNYDGDGGSSGTITWNLTRQP